MQADVDTRQRLLDTAARCFAQHGFGNVTVRDLCDDAKANVAAVNYHFGSKEGLYRAVIDRAVEAMRALDREAREAGTGESPEEQLRVYVRVFLQRLAVIGHNSWIHQIIRREFMEPSTGLDVLIEQGLRPRFEYLGGIVGALIGAPAGDSRVMQCISSIQSQFLMLVPSPAFNRVYQKLGRTPPSVDEIAEHIAMFSLAGIRALATPRRRRIGRRPQRKPSA
jgi:AcrR family transcriptional regulator